MTSSSDAKAAKGGRAAAHFIGSGAYRYRFERHWARLPRWWTFGSDGAAGPPRTAVSGAVAPNGDVYVLCRGPHPVIIFEPSGQFVTSWGEGLFSSFAHGLTIDGQGCVWIADAGLHTVTQHDPSGVLIRTIGTPGAAAPTYYGAPFNMPTGVAFSSSGEFYVSDGYGNRRVHCFSPEGELIRSWGQPGSGPGQFALVHYVRVDGADRVYVCDRENDRIQIFGPDGEMADLWDGFRMPSDVAFGRDTVFVAGGDGLSIWTKERQGVVRFGPDEPFEGAFNVHGIWLDAEENIYLAQFDRAVSKLTRV
jgi:streptogramin lyase